MRAGACRVFVRDHQVASPKEFPVSEETAFLEIRVQSAREVVAIRGVVVGENDRPMVKATVRQDNHGAVLCQTDAEGRIGIEGVEGYWFAWADFYPSIEIYLE